MDDYEYGFPDPEYGVFGDKPESLKPISEREWRMRDYWQKKQAAEQDVSRCFNRSMIDLYNQGRKP